LTVAISDDGRGFKVAESGGNGASNGMGGHGLVSMQRRARALGGSLQIDSEIGRGTTVTLEVPIRRRSRWRRWPINYPNGR
jgi:signal transduction histidine kinase